MILWNHKLGSRLSSVVSQSSCVAPKQPHENIKAPHRHQQWHWHAVLPAVHLYIKKNTENHSLMLSTSTRHGGLQLAKSISSVVVLADVLARTASAWCFRMLQGPNPRGYATKPLKRSTAGILARILPLGTTPNRITSAEEQAYKLQAEGWYLAVMFFRCPHDMANRGIFFSDPQICTWNIKDYANVGSSPLTVILPH